MRLSRALFALGARRSRYVPPWLSSFLFRPSIWSCLARPAICRCASLFPALLHRFLDGQIPAQSRIIGVARGEIDTDSFRALIRESHAKFAPGVCVDEAKCDDFLAHVEYVQLDATAPAAEWAPLAKRLENCKDKARIFYLATAPSLFMPIAQRLGETGLGDARRAHRAGKADRPRSRLGARDQ